MATGQTLATRNNPAREYIINEFLAGKVESSGANVKCSGITVSVDNIDTENTIIEAQTRYLIQPVTYNIDMEISRHALFVVETHEALPKGCQATDSSCTVDNIAYIWGPPSGLQGFACTAKLILSAPFLQIGATTYVNEEHGIFLQRKKGIQTHLGLGCLGIPATLTNLPDIYIFAGEDKPQLPPVESTDVNLSDWMVTKLAYLDYIITKNQQEQEEYLQENLCREMFLSSHTVIGEVQATRQAGKFIRNMGSSGQILHCSPMQVSLRADDLCYLDVPIYAQDQLSFLRYPGRRLVNTSKTVPCIPGLSQKVFTDNRGWIEVGKSLQLTTAPAITEFTQLDLIFGETPEINLHLAGITSAGLYTTELLSNLRQYLMYGDYHPVMMQEVFTTACQNTADCTNAMPLPPRQYLYTDPFHNSILGLWPRIHEAITQIGATCSVIVCLIFVCRLVEMMVSLLTHAQSFGTHGLGRLSALLCCPRLIKVHTVATAEHLRYREAEADEAGVAQIPVRTLTTPSSQVLTINLPARATEVST